MDNGEQQRPRSEGGSRRRRRERSSGRWKANSTSSRSDCQHAEGAEARKPTIDISRGAADYFSLLIIVAIAVVNRPFLVVFLLTLSPPWLGFLLLVSTFSPSVRVFGTRCTFPFSHEKMTALSSSPLSLSLSLSLRAPSAISFGRLSVLRVFDK